MEFNKIYQIVSADMEAVNHLIKKRLQSDVVLVNQLGHYIINSGGKRLRPMLALMVAKAVGYEGNQHIDIAAIIEFIHTATLLHDDVVDSSDMRRGKETANTLWGNEAAVLVGDFLYSRAFEMMVDVGELRVMEVLSSTTNIIAEGEVLQLLNCNNPDITEANYMEVIHSKTAKLFEAASLLGAILNNKKDYEVATATYGMHLGTAFQLVDDILDYTADATEMGKNVGDDLAEGKPTLPLIIALKKSQGEDCQLIREAIEKGNGMQSLERIMSIIKSTQAIDYATEIAKKETVLAIDALQTLPPSIYRDGLEALATFSISRTY